MSLLLTVALYYIITRRISIFNGTPPHKPFLLIVSFLITLMILGMLMSQFNQHMFFSILSSIGSRLMMLVVILAILMAIEHLISFLFSLTPLSLTKRGNRRGRTTLFLFFLLFAYGIHQALTTTLTETTITTDKISRDINILLVADFHVDDLISTLHLQELKKQIELQKPDLVLIAGDFFNRASVRQAQYYKVLS
ncbi:MAG: hypothetical protein LBD75_04555 [Candidatus Peribacteria bacterium]|jgi:hypothetical protein|nr:hypothetical protein [Candidatus Peribacteria bacterium]